MKKKIILFAALTCTTLSVAAVYGTKAFNKTLYASECNHVGNHYNALEATCSKAGHEEFWACCKCLQQFTTNPGGTWTDKGTTTVDATHLAYIAPTGVHTYVSSTGKCATCDNTVASVYGLQESSSVPFTISDCTVKNSSGAITTDYTIAAAPGTFISYEIAKNDGMDFYVTLNHKKVAGSYFTFYLGNGWDEKGIIIRLETNRVDAYQQVYFRTNSPENCEGVALTNAFNETNSIYLKATAPTADSDGYVSKLLHFSLRQLDKDTQKYAFNMDMSCDGGVTWASSKTPWFATSSEGNKTPFTGFNYTFGSNTGTWIRYNTFTAATTTGYLSDATFSSALVTLANDEGKIYGYKYATAGSTIDLPTMSKDGYKFLGWFDKTGNKVSSATLTSGINSYVARFIENQDTMFTLSDAGLDTKNGNWITLNTGEKYYKLPVGNITGNRYDVYGIFHCVSRTVSSDEYYFVGAPFDVTDEKNRNYIRLNNDANETVVSGYTWNKNDGHKSFSSTMPYTGNDLLIHIAVTCTSTNNFTSEYEFIDLGNGNSYSITISMAVTPVEGKTDYTINTANRNYIVLYNKTQNNPVQVTDAF